MHLPFTTAQFFDVFAAYNHALWPAAVVLWVASLVFSALLLWSRRPTHRWLSALLVTHWTWSALAYHLAFFTRISPAAWMFAMLFLVQAVLLFRIGVVQGRLSFVPFPSGRHAWSVAAWLCVGFSLLYPMMNALQHLTWSRIPTFGVPCPTTIFTIGLLMLAERPSWRLAIIPVIWSAIGGTAVFLFEVRADLALPIAGLALTTLIVHTRNGGGVSPAMTRPG